MNDKVASVIEFIEQYVGDYGTATLIVWAGMIILAAKVLRKGRKIVVSILVIILLVALVIKVMAFQTA